MLHCKELSDYAAKFIAMTCGRPTQPDACFNVPYLRTTYRSTPTVNSLEPDRFGIAQHTGRYFRRNPLYSARSRVLGPFGPMPFSYRVCLGLVATPGNNAS